MSLRDFWRGHRRDREDEERTRFPLDPLSRDSWRRDAEARFGAHHRDEDDERRHFNDRWENAYSGSGYGRFRSEEAGTREYGGSNANPFYGEHPLAHAGSSYDSDYFGATGLPRTRWQSEPDENVFDDRVYGGRSLGPDYISGSQGQFRGRGPRGYRRSDERIKEDVCQCLTDDRYIDASDVDVAVTDREVVLSGTVHSRAEKRHAEDLIERLPGVRDVINKLRVQAELGL